MINADGCGCQESPLPARWGEDWTPEEDARIRDLGTPLEVLERELGRPRKAISIRRCRLRARGDTLARLRCDYTPEEDARLRDLRAAGLPIGAIAQAMDRSYHGTATRLSRLALTRPRCRAAGTGPQPEDRP